MSIPFQYAASGGTLQLDDPSYIPRQADLDLYETLQRGEYCYVLNSRQVGKSSLIVRAALRLREENFKVASFELTKLGSSEINAEKWYRSLLDIVGRQWGKRTELVAFWNENKELDPLYRLMQALQHLVSSCSDIFIICLDEIDCVQSLPFSTDGFFAAIRSCFNDRTQQPDLQRLTFCLVGVVTPSELIQDARLTPFNIGRRIVLTDLTLEEMQPFAAGLLREPQVAAQLLQRIEYWTKGHPYLTQKLCQAVANDATVVNAAGVDRVCEDLFFDSRSRDTENNLQHVRTMLLQGKSEEDQAAILDLYRQVRRTKRVKDDDTNRIINLLRLSGLVKVWENYLWVRNHIYFRVFDEAWITANLPDAEQQRQRAAQRRGFLQALGMSAVVVAMMAGLTLWAVWAQREASRQEAIAIEQKEVAVRNEQLAEEQRNLAVKQKEIATQQKTLALQAVNTLTYDQIQKLLAEAPNARRSILAIFQSNIETLEAIYALAPEDSTAQREKSVNLNNIGDTWLVLGNTKEALQTYEQSLEIDKRLATADPQNAQAQRDLSVSYNMLGDVQLQLGNTQQALQAYEQSLEIRKRLATADPQNAQAQRDLSVSYNMLGDVQLQLGNTQQALQAYEQSLEIRKRLATADPQNAQAQRDLSISYENLGDVQLQLGNTKEALQAYEQTHEIRTRLATADPQNAEAQRDLSVSYNNLGNVQLQLDNTQPALQAYEQMHEILKRHATADPQNAEAQRDLSVSYERLGNVQLQLGNTQQALQAYEQSLEIRKRLATTDPQNAQAQRDLSVSYFKIAEINLKENKLKEALVWYQKALAIDEELAALDPLNQTLQKDLRIDKRKIADIEARLKQKKSE